MAQLDCRPQPAEVWKGFHDMFGKDAALEEKAHLTHLLASLQAIEFQNGCY